VDEIKHGEISDTVANMKMTVFWVPASYSLVEVSRRFRDVYCPYYQSDLSCRCLKLAKYSKEISDLLVMWVIFMSVCVIETVAMVMDFRPPGSDIYDCVFATFTFSRHSWREPNTLIRITCIDSDKHADGEMDRWTETISLLSVYFIDLCAMNV
jgi:hypothetical protein